MLQTVIIKIHSIWGGGLRKAQGNFISLYDFETSWIYNLDQIMTLSQMFFKILLYYYANSKCKAAKKISKQIFVFHYCTTQFQKCFPNFIDKNLFLYCYNISKYRNWNISRNKPHTFNKSSMNFLRTS